MTYYGKKIPNIDDIVFVNIIEYSTSGTYCKLIEYGLEGFILNTELDRKVYNPKKVFKIGEIYPVLVLAVTLTENNEYHIDLSFKKINQEDRQMLLDKFVTIQKIYNISKECSIITGLELNIVLEKTMWVLFKNDHLSDPKKIYFDILNDPSIFVKKIIEKYPDESKKFILDIKSRISTTNMTVDQKFELIVCEENAIDKLKEILLSSFNNVQMKCISSPVYVASTSGNDKQKCDEILDECMCEIKKKIDKYNCIYREKDRVIAKEQEYSLKPLQLVT